MDLSVVIPLYRSENTITPVIEEIREELARIKMENYEIILVNDCSPDNVLQMTKGLAAQDSRIKVVSLAKNSGQAAALMVGYHYASGEFIVSMDDDYQTPGHEIGKLIIFGKRGFGCSFRPVRGAETKSVPPVRQRCQPKNVRNHGGQAKVFVYKQFLRHAQICAG